MQLDDVIYVACLLTCIGAGNYFKRIPDETQRKFLATGFGLLMVFLVSGWHTLHCLISAAMGIAAVIFVHPRWVFHDLHTLFYLINCFQID